MTILNWLTFNTSVYVCQGCDAPVIYTYYYVWLTDWSIAGLSHQPPLRFLNFLMKSVTYQHISHIKVISITIIKQCSQNGCSMLHSQWHISWYSSVWFHWSQLFAFHVFFFQHPVTSDVIHHSQFLLTYKSNQSLTSLYMS